MRKRRTAGQLAIQAATDTTKYNSLDVGYALCDDVLDEIWKCIDVHKKIINEDEFCIVMLLAEDCLIKGVMRRKFYAWPFLPKPRPDQSCFLYNRHSDEIQFLWALPPPYVMAALATMSAVDSEYQRMQGWCKAFFLGRFWEYIRKEAGINLQSESEYLDTHREKLVEACGEDFASLFPKPLNTMDVASNKIIDAGESFTHQDGLDNLRQT
jgi:hypothetical protein